MQKEHRESLQRNYVKLVRETPVDVVADHLYQTGILTDEQHEAILSTTNSYSRARELRATLQRRGPRAFDEFCSALTAEGKGNLVRLLNKEDKTDASGDKERIMINIGGDIFVVVNEWDGDVLIHIRKYDKNSAGVYVPTRKGVALRMTQWQLLELYVEDIDAAIGRMIEDNGPEMTFHLGKGVYVTVSREYPTVDIRQKWVPPESETPVPTKKGISLTYDKWEALKETFPNVKEAVPEMENNLPCILSEDHQNQQGMLDCAYCNPFGGLS